MAQSQSVGGLVVLLILVALAFFVVLFTTDNALFEGEKEELMQEEVLVERNQGTLVELYAEREVPSDNVIVTDRYVRDLEEGADPVVVASDGSAYYVQGGTVLASDVLISKSDEGEFSIYRVDDPEKSVNY